MVRIITIGLIAGVTLAADGLAGERMTPERLWQLGRLGDACLSPDGKYIAYSVRNYDLQKNSGTSDIHVVDIQRQRDRAIVRGLASVGSLQFAERSGETRRKQ